MDETTTEAVTQDTGADFAQPEEQQAEAVQETVDSEPTNVNDQSSDNSQGDDTSTDGDINPSDFWSKKSIDISTAEGQAQATKAYQEALKAMQDKGKKANELEKQLSAPNGYDDDRIARVETILKTRDFFDAHPEARELESDMAKYINADESGLRRELIKQGILSLEEVHAIVSADPNRTTQLKEQGRTEGLQQLANKQRTTAVTGNAVNSAPAPKVTSDNVESWWDSLTTEQRKDPANISKLDSLL